MVLVTSLYINHVLRGTVKSGIKEIDGYVVRDTRIWGEARAIPTRRGNFHLRVKGTGRLEEQNLDAGEIVAVEHS